MSKVLDKAYEIVDWKDDPWSQSGRTRYLEALKRFEKLIKHPWFSTLLEKSIVKVIDIGAGRGIGGIAFARTLEEHGVKYELYLVDIREKALHDAKRFAGEEGVNVKTYVMDARRIHELGFKNIDLALMYGAILAHFNEWDLPKLFNSTSMILGDDGLLLLEEVDRDHILYTRGYKDLLVESIGGDKITLSIHKRYDRVTGSYYRLFINLLRKEMVEVPINFRSIAQIASMLWLFMEDIDVIEVVKNFLYYIIGYKPRRRFNITDLSIEPRVLKQGIGRI